MTIIPIEELNVLYKKGNLKKLNKELKKYSNDLEYLILSSINLEEKKYKINEHNDKLFTLYEYCILVQKYRYIKQYCH